ncbi:MAG: HdeD family acid-resistance protein [Mycobacterium sp.]
MSQEGATRPGGAGFGEQALAAGGLAFELAKKWWVLLLRGILLIIIGVLAFVSPLVWVTFVGIYMLIDGITMLMSGFSDQPAGQSRWPLVILGILGLVAGLIILWNPALGGITLTYIIAAWAVVGGILTIISALRLREEIDNEWWLVLSGILAVIFGILVFTNVLAGILTIAWTFGIFAIVVGILSIVLAFRVRDFGTQIGAVT